MKIAFILGQFPVLSEAFILNQIVGAIERGHEVDIYALQGSPNQAIKVHPLIEEYQLLDRTYYPPKRPDNELWRWIKGLALAIAKGYKHPRLCLELLNSSKYGSQARSLKLLYRAIPFFGKQPYDIIHCQFGTWGVVGMLLRQAGAIQGKLLVSFRGFDVSRYLQKCGDRVYDRLFVEGDFFLANCEFFRQRVIQLGCPETKIVVHGSGIDIDKFAFKPRSFPADGRIRIATTGRLEEKKGIEYAIQAIAKILPLYPQIEYQIIGDGSLKESLQQLIDRLQIPNNVKLLGWKHQQEIIEILDNAHLFLAPCVTAADGNQDAPVNTLKEAMAMGLPVISTYHGGIPELVEDGKSGFLVAERDGEAIAEKLQYLLENPPTWEAMGRAGRDRVLEKYDMEKLNDELVEIYQTLLPSLINRDRSNHANRLPNYPHIAEV